MKTNKHTNKTDQSGFATGQGCCLEMQNNRIQHIQFKPLLLTVNCLLFSIKNLSVDFYCQLLK